MVTFRRTLNCSTTVLNAKVSGLGVGIEMTLQGYFGE